MQGRFGVSERRACVALDQPRSTQRYESRKKTDEVALCRRLRELVRRRPRFGYRRLTAILRREGWQVNAKRIHRLCRKEGLKVRQHRRKRRAVGSSTNACHVGRAEHRDHVWTWDFVFNRTESGTTLKWLSIVDEFTRECLTLKVDRSITSEDVLDTLAELFAMRSVPRAAPAATAAVHRPGDPEMAKLKIETLYIAPGRSLGERLCGELPSKLRDEFLDLELFESLRSARTQVRHGGGLQPSPAAQLAGVSNPGGFAARCGSASVRATPSSSSPTATLPNPYSHNPWYRKWGQVTPHDPRSSTLRHATPSETAGRRTLHC
ncbi:MAG: IS3 family transposase [Planctomycetaceae bacterium]